MARPRLELQDLLETLGAQKVYFQPPNELKMLYPCIRYERDSMDTRYADNRPLHIDIRYTITVMDRDPDSAIPGRVALLPTCSFNRFYAVDNLNHDVFTLYF